MVGTHHALVATAMIAVVVSGCSRNAKPTRTPVSGVVSYQGKPVEGATVSFSPIGTGVIATAITDSSGKYALHTFEEGDGAVPGDYRVTIAKMITEDKMAGKSPDEISEAYIAMQARGEAIPQPQVKYLLPKQYATAETSTETASVKPGQPNTFDFNLVD